MLDLPLSFLHRPAAAATPSPWLLVLMHGVGSNEQDLFGLAPYLPPPFHVVSLRAPFGVGPGANAWFDFALDAQGERTINAEQERESRALAADAVAMAAAQLSVPTERVVVGGFSQGGIMALSLLLTRPELLQAALVWHSRLLPQAVADAAPAEALAGKQLWLSHGVNDDVIPLDRAQAIARHMANLPVQVAYHEFPGAHEIRPVELAATAAWLQALTTAA